MRNNIIFVILLFSLSGLLIPPLSVDAQTDQIMPDWFKNNAKWWQEGLISDAEMIAALESLMIQDIIPLDRFVTSSAGIEHQTGVSSGGTLIVNEKKQIPSYQKDVFGFWADGIVSDAEIVNSIGFLMNEGIINSQKIQEKREILTKQKTDDSVSITALRAKVESENAGSQLDDFNADVGGDIANLAYQTQMWNVSIFSQLLELKNFESEILKDASGAKWKEYGENKDQKIMDEAIWLENESRRVDKETDQALQSLNYAKKSSKLAKGIAIKKGIPVLDLEDGVQVQQEIIDSINRHFETISELKFAYKEIKKLQTKVSDSLQITLLGIRDNSDIVDDVLIGSTSSLETIQIGLGDQQNISGVPIVVTSVVLGEDISLTFAGPNVGETSAELNSAVFVNWEFSNSLEGQLQLRDWDIDFFHDVNDNLLGANNRFSNMRLVVLDPDYTSEIRTLFTSVDSSNQCLFCDLTSETFPVPVGVTEVVIIIQGPGILSENIEILIKLADVAGTIDKIRDANNDRLGIASIQPSSNIQIESVIPELQWFDFLLAPEIIASYKMINDGMPAYEFQIDPNSGVATNETGRNLDTSNIMYSEDSTSSTYDDLDDLPGLEPDEEYEETVDKTTESETTESEDTGFDESGNVIVLGPFVDYATSKWVVTIGADLHYFDTQDEVLNAINPLVEEFKASHSVESQSISYEQYKWVTSVKFIDGNAYPAFQFLIIPRASGDPNCPNGIPGPASSSYYTIYHLNFDEMGLVWDESANNSCGNFGEWSAEAANEFYPITENQGNFMKEKFNFDFPFESYSP